MQREYKGYGAIGGVGTGKVKIIDCSFPHYENRLIEDTDKELKRFVSTFKIYRDNTRVQEKHIRKTVGRKEAKILDSHIKITHDHALQNEITKRINSGMCAEQAISEVCDIYIERFLNADADFLIQLAVDVKDVKLCMLNLLLGIKDIYVEEFEQDKVIVAKELTPSIIARLDRVHTKAVVVENGSPRSHSALLVKAMNIPGITHAENIHNLLRDGETVTADGSTGIIKVIS